MKELLPYILGAALAPAVVIMLPIGVTLVLEYPFIIWGKVCDSKRFFVALNVLTNVAFNIVFYILAIATSWEALIWFLVAEAVIIPLCEAKMYLKVSKASTLRIYLLTYLANMASCGLGIAIFGLFS